MKTIRYRDEWWRRGYGAGWFFVRERFWPRRGAVDLVPQLGENRKEPDLQFIGQALCVTVFLSA
jgi:hypothetical protein